MNDSDGAGPRLQAPQANSVYWLYVWNGKLRLKKTVFYINSIAKKQPLNYSHSRSWAFRSSDLISGPIALWAWDFKMLSIVSRCWAERSTEGQTQTLKLEVALVVTSQIFLAKTYIYSAVPTWGVLGATQLVVDARRWQMNWSDWRTL